MSGAVVLETKRLRLVPFSLRHLTERYVAWLNDPEVVRYSEQRFRQHTLGSCREYWMSFEGTPHAFWAIEALDSSQGHVGNITAHVDAHNQTADVGILVGERAAWGRGLGGEAWSAVVEHLLAQPGVRKVTAGTLSCNAAMLAVMRRSGMVDDGRRARQCLVDGAEMDVVHAARFRA